MSVDLELAPKQKRPPGEPCCEPVVYPDVERQQAERMAEGRQGARRPSPPAARGRAAKARRQGLRLRAGALFDLSQPTVSHHLKKLREAGIVGSERRGLWAYYYVIPESLEEISAWLS